MIIIRSKLGFIKRIIRRAFPNLVKRDLGWILSNLEITPDVIFDIGANVGNTIIVFRKYFPQAMIFGFEPASETYHQLQKNLTNELDHVKLVNLGFSSVKQSAPLNITIFNGANSICITNQDYLDIHPQLNTLRQEEIQLVTMDEYVEQNKITHIDLVKIDVEGYELEVLAGGKESFLGCVDAILIEISFARQGIGSNYWIRLLDLLYSYGFDMLAIYDEYYNNWPKVGLRLEQMDALFGKRNKKILR